jgi:hypothetical protein
LEYLKQLNPIGSLKNQIITQHQLKPMLELHTIFKKDNLSTTRECYLKHGYLWLVVIFNPSTKGLLAKEDQSKWLESKGLGVFSNFGNHPKKLLEAWRLRFSCIYIYIIIFFVV